MISCRECFSPFDFLNYSRCNRRGSDRCSERVNITALTLHLENDNRRKRKIVNNKKSNNG